MAGRAEPEPNALKLTELLFRVTQGQYTPSLLRAPGITDCGRWAYRYDDEGRFFAVLLER